MEASTAFTQSQGTAEEAAELARQATEYYKAGNYPKALPLYESALPILEKARGSEHLTTANLLGCLAMTYREMGNNTKALPLFERALAINEKTFGPEHPNIASFLSGLASIYADMGNYTKALPLYERALSINEKTLGPEHPDTALTLNLVSRIYRLMGNFAKALSFEERALSINEKTLGPEHPDTGGSLLLMAKTYECMGNYTKALPLYERALSINEKTLGPEHPSTLVNLEYIALSQYLAGSDLLTVREPLAKVFSAKERALDPILSMDEATRLSWRGKILNYDMIDLLRPEQMTQFIIRTKGVVLDSLMEDRVALKGIGSDTPEWLEVQSARFRIGKIAFSIKKEDQEEVTRLKSRIETIMSATLNMRKKYGRVRESITINPDSISLALPSGGLLIDFIQFDNPKIKGRTGHCYGALILGRDGDSKLVRLNDASVIDAAIRASREALIKGDEKGLIAQQKALSEKLWEPLAKNLPAGTTKLFIGGDGALNFLSFATLPSADGSFLAEHYEIAYVGSGRDLARKGSAADSKTAKSISLFADPVFDRQVSAYSPNALALRSGEIDELGRIVLPPLPGTRAEEALVEQAAKASGWSTDPHLAENAVKSQLTILKSPGILHLATHGFYLNSLPNGDAGVGAGERGMKVMESFDGNKPTAPPKIDPMHASGIALTGAQSTLRAWSVGKVPDPKDDGILTAEEVAGLDLDGTWLVTLSACETGVGEARSGEGVFGLRRAFMMAGAQNLLMTLWPVSDETTPKIMADFYKEALATHDAAGSLAKVQRNWLVKLRKEKGLLAAVRDVGPFAMVVMANPNLKSAFAKAPAMPVPQPASAPLTDSRPKAEAIPSPRPVSTPMQPIPTAVEPHIDPNAVSAGSSGRNTRVSQSEVVDSSKVLGLDDVINRADSGDAYAQAVASIYYGLGYKAPKDTAKSVAYVMKSAQQGNPLGIYRLGAMRQKGEGMQKDEAQGIALKAKAFSGLNQMTDDPYAMTALGIMEFRGEGVPKNKVEAARLYKKAADMGYAPAQYNYACLLVEPGAGGDPAEAAMYKQKAAEQGYPSSK